MIYFLFIAVALISLFSALKIIKQQKKESRRIYKSLSYYFGLKRDYKIYVSCKGFSNWQKVQSLAEIKKSRIKNFCVCYPSGEILEIYSNVEKLPEGVHWLEENEGLGFEEIPLDEVDLSQKQIKITNTPSKNPSGVDYETTITNKTAENLYPIAFGGYLKDEEKGAFVLDNVSDSVYSAKQFKNWYGMKNDYLSAGESVSDPNNYGGGDGYWIYIFKTESGEIKTVGCFLEDLVIENMKNQYFTKQN